MYTFEETGKYQGTVKRKADGKTGKRDADRKADRKTGEKTVNIEECIIPNLSLRDRDIFSSTTTKIYSF